MMMMMIIIIIIIIIITWNNSAALDVIPSCNLPDRSDTFVANVEGLLVSYQPTSILKIDLTWWCNINDNSNNYMIIRINTIFQS